MPRFHFNVYDGHDMPDLEGRELPNIAAAKSAAARYAGELIATAGWKFWNTVDWRMEVQDESGMVLFALYFAAIDAPSTPRVRPTSSNDGIRS